MGHEKALEGGVLRQRIGEVPHGVLESSFGTVGPFILCYF